MKWSLRILKYLLGVHYTLFILTIHLSLECLSFGKKSLSRVSIAISASHSTSQIHHLAVKNGGHVLLRIFFSIFNTVNTVNILSPISDLRGLYFIELIQSEYEIQNLEVHAFALTSRFVPTKYFL